MRIIALLLLLLPITITPTSADPLGDAVSDFGYEYFRSLDTEETDTAVSPLSIHAAFALLTLGSSGETRNEAEKVLRVSDAEIRRYQTFMERLKPENDPLSLACRLFPSDNLELSQDYLQASKASFGAAPQNLNYSDPATARQTINKWVSDNTEKLIEELIPPNGINQSTELVLANALYFKGRWQEPFSERKTRPGTFHSPSGDLEVPMMSSDLSYALYHTDKTLHAVSLPYADSNLAMAFVMPLDKGNWSATQKRLGPELLGQLERSSRENGNYDFPLPKVQVTIPKFKVSQDSQPIPLLKSLGLDRLLGSAPQLARLSTNAAGLQVTDCFHQAVVEVDEKGTKAAAATAITMSRSMPQLLANVIIDRPFFFVIYDRESSAPLFIGSVSNPRQEK